MRSLQVAAVLLVCVVTASAEEVHYSLVVTTCHLHVGDVSTWTRCYNGTVPGPTLRVKPGQTLKVSLINSLGADHNERHEILNVSEGTGSLFGSPNTTNLHLHGLVISAASPADDVMMAVDPGSVFNYIYHVPSNHMGGTLWYHPHHHHSTAGQANGGMFGALLVDDPPSSLPPPFQQAEERLMLVNTLDVGLQRAVARMSRDKLWQTASNATVTLVNGTLEPRSIVRSGVWYRMRFVYASMFSSIRLALNSDSATCQMQLLAKDGIYLNEVPRQVNRMWLASGNRADVMVSCSCNGKSPCQATFRSEWGPRDAAEFRSAEAHWQGMAVTRTWVGDVFHLDVEGNTPAATLPAFRPRMPCYLADLISLSDDKLSPGNRVKIGMLWEQQEDNGLGRGETLEYGEFHSVIHGKFAMVFNGTRVRMLSDSQKAVATLPFDEVQEWTIQGTQYHPFHTHGQPYQIVGLPSKVELMESLITRNFDAGKPLDSHMNATIRTLIDDDDGWFQVGDWADTFHDLGPHVVVRMAPRLPDLASIVFHCHYLNHEDQGMMTFVDVEAGSATCTKGAQCAKALDPQCYSDSTDAGFALLQGAGRRLRR